MIDQWQLLMSIHFICPLCTAIHIVEIRQLPQRVASTIGLVRCCQWMQSVDTVGGTLLWLWRLGSIIQEEHCSRLNMIRGIPLTGSESMAGGGLN